MVIKTASKRGEAHISALANFGYWRSRFSFSPLSRELSTVNRDDDCMYDRRRRAAQHGAALHVRPAYVGTLVRI